MKPRDTPESTLRQLVREARAEVPAELDWSRVERRLLQETRRTPAPAARSVWPLAWAALAVAALVAMWLAGGRAPATSAREAEPVRVATTDPRHRDGDLMTIGTRVATGELPVSVRHAGRAAWTLAADSSARLAAKGERITVQLERGSVRSEVTPSPKPETFVVEAAGTRVAVHGTVFRVGLELGRVIVEVSEGTVAVGPIGAAPSFLLKAPARGEFAPDGRRGDIDGRPAGGAGERRTEPLKPVRPRAPSSAPAGSVPAPTTSSATPPHEPSINDIELGVARVVEITSDCFRSHIQSVEGVQITVRTALSLQITGSGAVANVGFQPPLSPEAERCAKDEISQVAFAPSQQGATVTRMLELKR